MNIDDALKALPDGLTWKAAIRSHDEAALLWKISGEVALDQRLNDVDRRRLADALVKANKLIDADKENITMTDEAVDISMFDEANRPFLLAASKHRAKLQKYYDTDDLFLIAKNLRTQFEAQKAADAAKKPAAEPSDDFSGNRPGWRHDKRKKEQTAVVRSDDPTKSEEALSDARAAAYQDSLTYAHNAYKIPSMIEDELVKSAGRPVIPKEGKVAVVRKKSRMPTVTKNIRMI